MSNSSLDSFLTRIGDVTIERVAPRGGPKAPEQVPAPNAVPSAEVRTRTANDDSSEESGGETSEGEGELELEKKNESLHEDEIEEIGSEGSGDDMDLDETVDSQIGVRMESEKQPSSSQEDDVEAVNILDSLPLEGAPIEGQEVTEADLLGKSVSKETDTAESTDNEDEKMEGQIEDEEEGETSKRRADSEDPESASKKQKSEDGNESSSPECETKVEKKLANMRRNIREVMDETQLDEATLAAQRQEMERLRRVQEQQRIIREVQRQIAINRQNSKTQTRVISLLQGKQGQGGTTISPSSSSSSSQVRLPSTVLLKVNSGSGSGSGSAPGYQSSSTAQASHIQRRAADAMRWQKGRGVYQGAQTSISRVPSRPSGPNMLQQRIRMMTPSVSISPVVPKKEPVDRSEYYSDSDMSDGEAEQVLREKQMHTLRKVSGMPKLQKPAKGKDVVTISSSSESSDDDCIVLSDPSGGEETDNDDDPSNSGMHTNDRYNVPDEHGRVLVNVGHPETEPDVFLAPQVARIIKPHQIGGIRFLYDNIVESIDRYKTSSGFGCILAHSMGLGKTLQVASFCDVFFRCTTAKTVLCIMPINTLQNWLAEFNMWLPYGDQCDEKADGEAIVKSEAEVESKQDMKEESGNLSDTSNISRPISTESAQRVGQESVTQSSNISTEKTFSDQGYETQSTVSSFAQDSVHNKSSADPIAGMGQNYQNDMSQNTMYGSNSNAVVGFPRDPAKSELDCHVMPTGANNQGMNFSMENHGLGSTYGGLESCGTGPMYPDLENQSAPGSVYPNVENRPPAPTYPGLENPPASQTYPGYNTTMPGANREVKQEPGRVAEFCIKKEPEEFTKKEEDVGLTKEAVPDEKKPVDKVKTPFCVDCPINMEMRPRHFRLHILNDSHKTMAARARVIREWQKGGGVLLIGYELYRQLSLKKPNKAKRKRGQPFKDTVDIEEEDKNKGLLDDMHSALVNPGPDLVICDEGHRIKNSHASISLALKQMRTKRRIVLTGYPLQNNLLEYWCMVDFVRPNYLGTKSEFCNMFERPIQNGQCIDSTPQDIRLMRYRAHVLHALLEGFVQRRSHSVLQVSLPRKEEYILLVRMTPHQRKLYDTFMNQVVKTRAVPNPLKAFAVCCKIWNHPDVLYHFLKKRQANEEDDLDLEETMGDKPAPGAKRTKARQPKGEPKKGKKAIAAVRNKPAASVQPNASSSSNIENAEGENRQPGAVVGTYQTYPMQMPNSVFPNSAAQGSYPQGYQNYRPNEQSGFYRNDNTQGEYNEFYGSQGQHRYGNQSFQSYPQGAGYNPAQGYQNSAQSYLPGSDQSGSHSQGYPSGPPNHDFRAEQNQGSNYETSGLYPRQPYPYQDQGRNYTSGMNTGANYPEVAKPSQSYQNPVPNQAPSLPPIQDFSSFPPTNQPHNYTPTTNPTGQIYSRGDNQTPQNLPASQSSTLGYTANQQSQNSTSQNQTSGYPTPNQQSQNPPSQNQAHSFPPNQQGQNPALQNQPHGYPSNQQGQNPASLGQTQNYASNQQGHGAASQNPNHNYPSKQSSQNSSQSQAHGYPPNQQAQNSASQNQSHNYPTDQQGQNSGSQSQTLGYPNQQNKNPMPQNQTHGYPGNLQGPNSTSVPSQNQTHGYPPNQPVQNSALQNQSHGYTPNQQSQNPGQNQAHRYPSTLQGPNPPSQSQTHGYASNQQGSNPSLQNQAHSYPTNQQNQNLTSTQSGQIYPLPDNQTSQNFTSPQSETHDYPADHQSGNPTTNPASSYPPNREKTQNQLVPNFSSGTTNPAGQFKGPEDPYWQQNYSQSYRQDQCSDTFYEDSSTNRYQNNYYPGQNYQSQPYDFDNGKSGTGTNAQTRGAYDETTKETTSSIGVQSQIMTQNNVSSGTGFNSTDSNRQNPAVLLPRTQANDRGNLSGMGPCNSITPRLGQSDLMKDDEREREDVLDKDKEDKSDDEILNKDEDKDFKSSPGGKEDPGIPYDWATELMKGYVPGLIDASAKMTIFFCILEEAVRLSDRVLAFSQSLFTLNLIEDFLSRNSLKNTDGQTEDWVKNVNYYRLDGSTSALEREKLINEFNANPKIHLFLVSTRAGSLGINLVGANRAIVFDASWNPCHDTQAVCRVYRYGQRKQCFVYRLVTDNCLERKIYDRQISKQGMADRVVDQCNPDAHLSLKEAATLSWDWEEDSQVQDFSQIKDTYADEVMHCLLERHSSLLTKQPFRHESLLVDRKDKKLSQAEKRLARRGYELEKMAANCSRPSYSYVPGNTATRAGGLQIRAIRGGEGGTPKPVASVRPMQQRGAEGLGGPRSVGGSRWIPAEVWQRQGMSAQEMTLPLDVVIPTNSPDKGSIVLKAGQRVMVLKSPKGIYMQLESGKIIAIRTALKLNQQKRDDEPKKGLVSMTPRHSKPEVGFPLRNNSAISIIPKSSSSHSGIRHPVRPGGGLGYRPFADKEMTRRPRPVATAAAKPYLNQVNLTNQVSLSRLPRVKQEQMDPSSLGENSNSSDCPMRTEQRVEEVQLEDVVAEVTSNSDYDHSNLNLNPPSNVDSEPVLKNPSKERSQTYAPDNISTMQSLPAEQNQTHQDRPLTTEQQCQPLLPGEPTKEALLKNYGHNFPGLKENLDITTSDEIIIEEPTAVQKAPDFTKSLGDSSNSSNTSTTLGANALSPKEPEANPQEDAQGESQGFPYAQYPRYYNYPDPRSRSLTAPFGTYLPSAPSPSMNPRLTSDMTPKSQPDSRKPVEEGSAAAANPGPFVQPSGATAKIADDPSESKSPETTSREDSHVPTAFSQPTNPRYPGPYPPGPYDAYSQHYPPAPGSSAAYPPGGAPGYPAYAGPTFDAEYARMYSALHGPPSGADHYMHRGYTPPSSHPPNYYPPFPHPPPPYPNYSFLPPYPNPNMPSEPQPPTQ